MRILTVRQPWAWAIFHGGKNVENRVRNIAGDYRGPVAIHAGLRFDDAGPEHPEVARAFREYHAGIGWGHYGLILGIVTLTDVHRANGSNPGEPNLCAPYGLCSPWAEPNTHHLTLTNPTALAEPIPFRGALGLRDLDAGTVAAIEGQLTKEPR